MPNGFGLKLLYSIALLLLWALRRQLLVIAFGYGIHPTSRIGFAWLMPEQLMEPYSKIGTLTVCQEFGRLNLRQSAARRQVGFSVDEREVPVPIN